MTIISPSSLFMVGQRVAKYCRAILALDNPSVRTGIGLSSAFRPLITVVEADYGRIASSTIRALSDGLLLCLAVNMLLITCVAVLCVSGYGIATGLSIVALALAPTLMLLNIALLAGVSDGRRAISTNTQASRRSETHNEREPTIVRKTSETANTQASRRRLRLRLGPAARRAIAKWTKAQVP